MTSSWNGSLWVWNLQLIGENWRDGQTVVNAIALSPEGNRVSGSDDGAVRLWNIGTGKVIATWKGQRNPINHVFWNGDGGRVLSGSREGTTRVCDTKSGKTVRVIEMGLRSLEEIIYSPDMAMIATGGEGNKFLEIWDANTANSSHISKDCDTGTWNKFLKSGMQGLANSSQILCRGCRIRN
jgi:WD40 repeat protein